ncbi:MAG: hypothetical protein LBC07_02250, partial [Elusimicrobiota bacterium]|nr:hypothetical protein [Elusimicrobiota bacterium]
MRATVNIIFGLIRLIILGILVGLFFKPSPSHATTWDDIEAYLKNWESTPFEIDSDVTRTTGQTEPVIPVDKSLVSSKSGVLRMITGTSDVGAIQYNGLNFYFRDIGFSEFENALVIFGGAKLTFEGLSNFINNSIDLQIGGGGAIYAESQSTVTFLNAMSNFTGNGNANAIGGAVYLNQSFFFAAFSTLVFSNNSAMQGGAFYLINSFSSFTYSSISFIGHNIGTSGSGGALYLENSTITFDTGNTFFSNNFSASGGAIYADNSRFIVGRHVASQSTFSVIANTGQSGGGAYLLNSRFENILMAPNVLFTSNTVSVSGGAMYLNNSVMSFIRIDTGKEIFFNFNFNSANQNGGGLYLFKSSASFDMYNQANSRLEFIGNTAAGNGGAIYAENSKITFIESRNLIFKDNMGNGALNDIYMVKGSNLEFRGNDNILPNGLRVYLDDTSVLEFRGNTNFYGSFQSSGAGRIFSALNYTIKVTTANNIDSTVILSTLIFSNGRILFNTGVTTLNVVDTVDINSNPILSFSAFDAADGIVFSSVYVLGNFNIANNLILNIDVDFSSAGVSDWIYFAKNLNIGNILTLNINATNVGFNNAKIMTFSPSYSFDDLSKIVTSGFSLTQTGYDIYAQIDNPWDIFVSSFQALENNNTIYLPSNLTALITSVGLRSPKGSSVTIDGQNYVLDANVSKTLKLDFGFILNNQQLTLKDITFNNFYTPTTDYRINDSIILIRGSFTFSSASGYTPLKTQRSSISFENANVYFMKNSIPKVGKNDIFPVIYGNATNFWIANSTLNVLQDGSCIIFQVEGGGYQMNFLNSILNANENKLNNTVFHFSGDTIGIFENSILNFTSNTSNDMGTAMRITTWANIKFNASTLTFSYNISNGRGGALAGGNYPIFIFNNSLIDFTSNTSKSEGGAIASQNETKNGASLSVKFNNSFVNFTSNTAFNKGGAIYAEGRYTARIHFVNSRVNFFANESYDIGGAIYLIEFTGIAAEDKYGKNHGFFFQYSTASFINNKARNLGGAIYAITRSEILFTQSNIIFSSNSAQSSGGAIYAIEGSIVNISTGAKVLFEKNSVLTGGGGAIYLINTAQLSFYDSSSATFLSNSAQNSNGGAVYADNGVLFSYSRPQTNFMSQIFFINNTANSGGAIYAANNSISNFRDALINFTGNEALNGSGGAISLNNSSFAFVNSTVSFSNNSANLSGGAISLQSSTLSFINSSIEFFNNKANTDLNDIAFQDPQSYLSFYGRNTLNGLKISGAGTLAILSGITLFKETPFEFTQSGQVFYISSGTALFTTLSSTLGNLEITNNGSLSMVNGITENTLNVNSLNLNFANLIFDIDLKSQTGDLLYVDNVNAIANSTISANIIKASKNAAKIMSLPAGADLSGLFSLSGLDRFVQDDGDGRQSVYLQLSGAWNIFVSNLQNIESFGTVPLEETAAAADFQFSLAIGLMQSKKFEVYGENYLLDSSRRLDLGFILANSSAAFYDISFLNFVSSQFNGGVFSMENSSSGFFSNINFSSNSSFNGGAAYALRSMLYSKNAQIKFSSNSAAARGGANYLDLSVSSFNNSIVNFENNFASTGGAVFAANNSKFLAYNSSLTFLKNSANVGGALDIKNSLFEVLFSSVYFINNYSVVTAGALAVEENGKILFSNSLVHFTSNTNITNNSSSGGGAIYLFQNSSLSFHNSDVFFTSNSLKSGYGGAIYSIGANIDFVNSNIIFSGNNTLNSNYGGAIYSANSNIDFINSNIVFSANNASNGSGAAIYANSGSTFSFIGQAADKNSLSIVYSNSNSGAINVINYSLLEFSNMALDISFNYSNYVSAFDLENNSMITFNNSIVNINQNLSRYSSPFSLRTQSSLLSEGSDFIFSSNTSNFSNSGGALALNSSFAHFANSKNIIFSSNTLVGSSGGGALRLYDAALTFENIENILFANNAAANSNAGGAIYMMDKSTLTFKNSTITFLNNTAANQINDIYINNFYSRIIFDGSNFLPNGLRSQGVATSTIAKTGEGVLIFDGLATATSNNFWINQGTVIFRSAANSTIGGILHIEGGALLSLQNSESVISAGVLNVGNNVVLTDSYLALDIDFFNGVGDSLQITGSFLVSNSTLQINNLGIGTKQVKIIGANSIADNISQLFFAPPGFALQKQGNALYLGVDGAWNIFAADFASKPAGQTAALSKNTQSLDSSFPFPIGSPKSVGVNVDGKNFALDASKISGLGFTLAATSVS